MEMENSTPPMWIQWISREANELCNKLTLVIDEGMNGTLLEFRPIPKDVEPEGEQQQDLMGFETLRPDNAIENRGEESNKPQRELRQPHHQQQLENVNTTQANIHQVTETEVNGVTGTEEGNQLQLHRLQSVEVMREMMQEANGEALHNCIDEDARGSIEDNAESILNTNSSNNQCSTENNRVNIAQVPEERNENSQIYSMVNLQSNANISQQPVPS